jgi:hypothetical protein
MDEDPIARSLDPPVRNHCRTTVDPPVDEYSPMRPDDSHLRSTKRAILKVSAVENVSDLLNAFFSADD